MGANKQLFDKKEADAFAGKDGLKQYIKPKSNLQEPQQRRKVGRPKKRKRPRQPPEDDPPLPPPYLRNSSETPSSEKTNDDIRDETPSSKESNENLRDGDKEPAAKYPMAVGEDGPAAKKKTRINWGKGVYRERMKNAINDWLTKTGDACDDNGEEIDDWRIFANKVGIPFKSFYRYINPKLKSRKTLGDGSRGKKKLLLERDIKFAGAVLARTDWGNDGMSRKEAFDMIQDLNPHISRAAARQQLSRIVIPTNAEFAAAVAEINRLEAVDKEEEKKRKHKVFEDNAPAAAKKLQKDPSNIGKLKVKEIEALLYKVYNVTISGSKLRKLDHTKALEKELVGNRGKYEEFVLMLGSDMYSPT